MSAQQTVQFAYRKTVVGANLPRYRENGRFSVKPARSRKMIENERNLSHNTCLFSPLGMCYPLISFEEITMLQLPQDTEQLVRLMAAKSGRTAEDVIRTALEREAKALGVSDRSAMRRMTAAEMLTFGKKVAARPVLDPRSPQEIADDLNAL
jgi:antitoxin VapB